MGAASTIDIIATGVRRNTSWRVSVRCAVFSTTNATLAAGDYAANERLIDAAGNARTTTLNMTPFTLVPNSKLVIVVNFPADSFF